MNRRRIILVACLLSQLVIAIHPACVRYFAYADSAVSIGDVTSSEAFISASQRPVEVVAAHRVPLANSVYVLAARLRSQSTNAPAVDEVLRAAQTSPPFLAPLSRAAFLREHALLI